MIAVFKRIMQLFLSSHDSKTIITLLNLLIVISFAIQCPYNLQSYLSEIDDNLSNRTNFTIPKCGTSRQLIMFPENSCAYWKANGKKKVNLQDYIPAFQYLKCFDRRPSLRREVLKKISDDIEYFGNYCHRNLGNLGNKNENKKFLGIQIISEPTSVDKDGKVATIGFLRFKCSNSDVVFVKTRSIRSFHESVKRNVVILYVYGGRVKPVRLVDE